MSIPGFTAEASLCNTKNAGYQYGNDLVASSGQRVVPQMRRLACRISANMASLGGTIPGLYDLAYDYCMGPGGFDI